MAFLIIPASFSCATSDATRRERRPAAAACHVTGCGARWEVDQLSGNKNKLHENSRRDAAL